MERIQARFAGVELYFENLEKARSFYLETMGLQISDEQIGQYAKFETGAGFICLERKESNRIPQRTRRFSSLK
jgi:catechol-2,3-dioxygenase